jgi:hypothetical protein
MTKHKPSRDIREFCAEYGDEGILLADGFNGAFLGVGAQFHNSPVAIYDRAECIAILARDFLVSDTNISEDEAYEQAEEYFDFNVSGSWVGEQTPIFIDRFAMVYANIDLRTDDIHNAGAGP